ncbi:MAG: dCMP deaminase family protein [Desulfuromonadales bacterium]|jgi:dCMP deaminase
MSSADWDSRWMALAQLVATWSKDRGRKVGAVIVGPDNEVRSTGFNGIPRGVNDNVEERHDAETGEKYLWVSHAERNAIYNAALLGVSTKSCTIYVPWYPCIECAKAIVQAGIAKIVCFEPDLADSNWGRDFEKSLIILGEGNVVTKLVEQKNYLQATIDKEIMVGNVPVGPI